MRFAFIAKHRGIWPADWLCEALGVSRGGFHAWLTRPPSARSRSDETLAAKVRNSFLASDRTYGARRVWHDLLAEGISCGLHRIERLMRSQALRARPKRRRLPPDTGDRSMGTAPANVLDRRFEAPAPNRKWVADFTYVWTAEGDFRSNLHRGGAAATIKITPEERSTAVRSAKSMGLNVCGVDLLRSNHGSVVMEVNSSPGLEGVEKATGIDVAGAIIEFLEKNAKPHRTKTRGRG